jgi:Glycosyl hydrolase family 26
MSNDSLPALQAAVSQFQTVTGSTVTCIGVYTDSSQTWTDWSRPWITGPDGAPYQSWVAEAPQRRQLVIEVDLIPQSLQDVSNPLTWETACAAGSYNSYAAALGANLVNAGLGDSVIRLGSEMNGPWEADFIGTTTQEQGLWASCFANEVTSLRSATGQSFLIDWNPNACTESIPYANYYPGNAYVDIVGLDFYDVDCQTPSTAVSFSQLSNETAGLTSFEAFAASNGKPMSFPEWGLSNAPAGDDAAYINGVGSTVMNGNFAFQEFFDTGSGNTLPIDTGSTPLSAAQYQKWFG